MMNNMVGSNMMDGGHGQMAMHPNMHNQGHIPGGPPSGITSPHTNRPPRKIHQKYRPINHDSLSLVDAAKQELTQIATKTPVSILQELLVKRGLAPKYELVQIEGFIHQPMFRYRVMFGEIMAHGTGRTKKIAKHKAAKALLEKLAGEVPSENNNANGAEDAIEGGVDPFNVNPIGWLQEMCMKKVLPPPQYVTEMEEGTLAHEKEFTVACILMNHREVGRAKNKKAAKRFAALRMWQLLQDPQDPAASGDDEISKIRRELVAKMKQTPTPRPDFKTNKSLSIAQLNKAFKQYCGDVLAELQTTALNKKDFNYIEFLKLMATKPPFEVAFTDLEEKTSNNQYQCLVQLSTIPAVICYGSGNSVRDAQSSAAHSGLEYLKLMVSKK